MLGLLDRSHAFVLLQRFRQRYRPRVTDAVALETARIAINTQKERFKRNSVRLKQRMCASREEGKGKKKNGSDGRKGGGREMI